MEGRSGLCLRDRLKDAAAGFFIHPALLHVADTALGNMQQIGNGFLAQPGSGAGLLDLLSQLGAQGTARPGFFGTGGFRGGTGGILAADQLIQLLQNLFCNINTRTRY